MQRAQKPSVQHRFCKIQGWTMKLQQQQHGICCSGLDLSDWALVLIANFRSQFNLVGRAGPAMNSLYFANADRYAPAYFGAQVSNKNIIVWFLINEIEISVCKNEKQIQIGKCHHLSQAFSFLQKWGWTANRTFSFFPEIGSFDICRCIQSIPRIGTYLQFLGSQFEKWRPNIFGGYFESILSTKQF